MLFGFHEVDALEGVDVVVAVHAQAVVLAAATRVEDLQVGHLELLPDLEQLGSHSRVDD